MIVLFSVLITLSVIAYFVLLRKKKGVEENSGSIPKSYVPPKNRSTPLNTGGEPDLSGIEFNSPEPGKPLKHVYPSADTVSTFEFKIDDVFQISGRGIVVTGTISKGVIKINDKLFLVKPNGTKKPVTVKGIEQFRKVVIKAGEGEAVGVLLNGITKEDVERNDFLLSE